MRLNITRGVSIFLSLFVSLWSGLSIATVNPVAKVAGRHFDRVIFVIFENTNYKKAIKQPFFKELADKGALLTNFLAATHPSQGNYLAMTSGSTHGVQDDKNIDLDVTHIGDLLEAKGISWKSYVEDYPGDCFLGKSAKNYARKHNPFISYVNIQKDPVRCANIVNSKEFDRDVNSSGLPQYLFYVPDMKNDGHDTGVGYADNWYRETFSKYFEDEAFMRRTVVVTTFDESSGGKDNQIYTSLVGPGVKAGTVVDDELNFYSLLKMIEDNWALGTLGQGDVGANPIPASLFTEP